MPDYFEDLSVGQGAQYGEYEVSRDEIISFARKFDPQPFHLDEEKARQSMFGGLIASGWHTASITMRLLVEHFFDPVTSRGALGVNDLRWSHPVRPGNVLYIKTEIVDKKPWKNGIGLVHGQAETFNQDNREVMSMVGLLLIARRPG